MSILVALLASFALVLANGFFVAAEFAIVKVRPTRLQSLAAMGGRRARAALDVSQSLDEYLSANQLGITLASLGLGWLGEPAFAALIEPLFAWLGAWSVTGAHSVAVAIAFALITLLHVVLGELVPKSIALQRTEPVALWTAGPLRAFYRVGFPVIRAFNSLTAVVLRLLRLRAATEDEMRHSAEEMRIILHQVGLEPGPERLIDRVFDYTHRVARHVMTLRKEVVVLEAGRTFDENMQAALLNQYTRYPLVDPKTDDVIGYVHLKDVVAALATDRRPARMREIAREPIYTRDDAPLESLRREFQRRRVHLAVVRDAAGAFTGIVTLEDLLEEVVGEIQDEQDAGEVPPIVRREDGSFEAEGRITIDVAARELELRLAGAPQTVETLGAYVIGVLGRAPTPGDSIEVGGFRVTVIEVRDQKVRRLRGEPHPGRGDSSPPQRVPD